MRQIVARLNLSSIWPPGHPWQGSGVGLLVAYLLASSAVAVWASPPELVKAALALPVFAVLPILVGSALLRLLPLVNDSAGLDLFGRALIEWLVGSLALVSLAVTLQLTGQAFLLQRFGLVALALALGGSFVSRVVPVRPVRFRMEGATALALVAAVLVSFTPKAIAARYTPFPLISHNILDPLFFGQPALRMIEQGYLELENQAHAPGLLTLTAILSQLYNVDPLSVLWMGPFLLYAVFGAGLFLWARAVSGRSTFALLATGVGLFILTGNTLFQATPVILRSNTLLLALFPLGLYLTHRLVTESSASRQGNIEGLVALQLCVGVLFAAMNGFQFGVLTQEYRVLWMLGVAFAIGLPLLAINRSRWRCDAVPVLFIVIVAFQVFHVFEGAIFLTALIAYGLAMTLRGSRLELPVAAGLALAAVGFFLLQDHGVISFPPDFSLASSFVFGSSYDASSITFGDRAWALQKALSREVIALLVIGTAGYLAGRSDSYGRAVVIVGALMFLVYLLPDARAVRTNRALVPFLALLVVAGANVLGALARQAISRIRRDSPLLQEVVQFGLVAAVLPALVTPFVDFNSTVPGGQLFHSNITLVEYELAEWFSEETGENVRIISDYQTMLIVSSLSNKVSLTERKLFPFEMSEAGREQMFFIKDFVLRARASPAANFFIRTLADSEPSRERRYLKATGMVSEEPRYFVVWTTQTCLWSIRAGLYPIRRYPFPGRVTPSTVAQFSDPRYFRKVAQFGDQAYIFEVLPQPDSATSAAPAGLAIGAAAPDPTRSSDECLGVP